MMHNAWATDYMVSLLHMEFWCIDGTRYTGFLKKLIISLLTTQTEPKEA